MAFSALALVRTFTDSTNEGQIRVMGFASSILAAQNAEDVSKAIQSAAVPVNSYRLKGAVRGDGRRAALHVNSYLGVTTGNEYLDVSTAPKARFYAPAAPVGLELSLAASQQIGKVWPDCWKVKHWPSFSLSVFGSVIDVGTLASTRIMTPGDTASQPKVGFGQIFAPGGFVVLGLTESLPISIGYGIQRIANLRQVGDSATAVTRRGQLFAAVDVPIFRFGR